MQNLLAKMESINCGICGALDFQSQANLKLHQRSTLCKAISARRSKPLKSIAEQKNIGFQDLDIEPPIFFEESVSDSDPFTTARDHQEEPFDSTFTLLHWIRSCRNGMGLSEHDINTLFRKVLFHKSFKLNEVKIKSAADCERFDSTLYRKEDGWMEYLVQEETDDPFPIVLYYKEPVATLSMLFSNPSNADGFDLGPTITSVGINHSYSTPSTGQWWIEMQKHIASSCFGGVIAPLILYSDQTSLSNNGKVIGYPLVLSLANIACELRSQEEGHILLAVLPALSASNIPSHHRRLQIFHECLTTILKPLKQLSFRGTTMMDPFGFEQFVFPLLFAFVCDHPEGCKVTGTYDTNLSQRPCSLCLCGKDHLSDTLRPLVYRTEMEMKYVVKSMNEAASRSQANEISKQYSLHTVECALWGFNGGDFDVGSPYKCIHIDIMHQSDLGVFKTLVEVLRMIEDTSKQTLQILDERLLYIKKTCRYQAFRIPSSAYFCSNVNFAAFEHRAVMQVIIICMVGLFEDNYIMAMVLFLHWYKLACRTREYSESKIVQMDSLMHDAISHFKVKLQGTQKSSFNLVKIHAMRHFSNSVRRSGSPFEYSSNLYEQLHINLMKIAYRTSNRRDYTGQILKHNSRLQAYRRRMGELEAFEVTTERVSPLDQAVSTGTNVLSGTNINLRVSWLYPTSLQPLLKAKLPPRVQPFIGAQLDLFKLPECLKIYMQEHSLQGGEILQVSNSIAVPAGPGERFGDWPLYGRASHEFYGGPYYSNVSLQMEDSGSEEITEYAQLRLLFRASFVDSANKKSVQRELAFVRMYRKVPINKVSRLIRCVELTWADVSTVRPSKRPQRTIPNFLVVDIESILRVVHVLPNFIEEDHFFLNKYKF